MRKLLIPILFFSAIVLHGQIVQPGGSSYPGVTSDGANGLNVAGAVAVGTTNPVAIGGATGSCAGKYVLADGTGCGTPAGGGGASGDDVEFTGACDNATDDTAALNSALASLYTAGGGVLRIPKDKTCLIAGQITLPNDGAVPPHQVPLRITGSGGSANGYWTSLPTGASTLNMTYNSAAAKIFSFGAGKLEIDHVSLVDSGSDCATFILATNTTLHAHDMSFSGTNSGTAACNNAIQFGNPYNSFNGGVNAAFQGYGTIIEGVFFDKIQTGIYGSTYVQAAIFNSNTWSASCGGYAALEINGSVGYANANTMNFNLVEVTNYTYGFVFNNSSFNAGYANGFWDGGATSQAPIYLVGTSIFNSCQQCQPGYPTTDGFTDSSSGSTNIHFWTSGSYANRYDTGLTSMTSSRATTSAGDYIISPGPLNTNRVSIGRGTFQVTTYTSGNDPAAATIGPGGMYFNPNTSALRVSDGTNWLPQTTVSGTPTIGNCATWVSSTQVQDSGAPCGGTTGGFPMTVPTGLGAVTQIQGPSDQDFQIVAPNRLILKSTGAWITAIGPTSSVWVQTSAANSQVGDLIGGGGVSQLPNVVPLTAPQSTINTNNMPVKIDTTTAGKIAMTTTSDTGPGIVIGVCAGNGAQGWGGSALCYLQQTGMFQPTLGTGTCAIGQFVIVDATTNGRVQCTSTYTPGTVIGVAIAAQSTVGSTFNVLLGLR